MSVRRWLLGDRSAPFTVGLLGSWAALVVLPITFSLLHGDAAGGVPLLFAVAWLAGLRLARLLSPAARADRAMRRGQYEQALALCDAALAVSGRGAWSGTRRLVWLNRRTTALLMLGRAAQALQAALDAIVESPDPQTLGNCALVLLQLNRYDEAAGAARLALSLTRERSVVGHAVLAAVMLGRGLPAEAEALARAGLADVETLLPHVKAHHHAAVLAALARAERMQGHTHAAATALHSLRAVAGRDPVRRAMVFAEEAESLTRTPETAGAGFAALNAGLDLAPRYLLWYVTQPRTFEAVRDDPRLQPALHAATLAYQGMAAAAPSLEVVALELATAQKYASARPAPQSSKEALLAQLTTLAGTLLLLLVWTWRFFLRGM